MFFLCSMASRKEADEFIATLDALRATPAGRAWIRSVVREAERDSARQSALRIADGLRRLREDRNLALLKRLEPPSPARH
jgi:hypothetical protein